MKHILLFIALIAPFFATAQQKKQLTDGEPVLIYSLPKTVLNIQISSERITETPGEFYPYSERYLATTNVITAPKTYYRLRGITITPQTKPDSKRTFKITPVKNSHTTRITVNDKGILCGINVPPVEVPEKIPPINPEKVSPVSSKLLPLEEEYMMAGSTVKMAEGIAKQIYSIREGRLDLLAGQAETMPKDGESMKIMLEQMDRREQELTQLFTGKTTVEALTNTITYSPDSASNADVVFRFSAFNGLSSKEDLSGTPYYITVKYNPIETATAKKKKEKGEQVLSVLPVKAKITVEEGSNVIYNEVMDIPQLGIMVPIPLETMNKKNGKVIVSPETGRLLSIQ